MADWVETAFAGYRPVSGEQPTAPAVQVGADPSATQRMRSVLLGAAR